MASCYGQPLGRGAVYDYLLGDSAILGCSVSALSLEKLIKESQRE